MNDHSSHLEDRIDPAMNPEPRCLVELVLDRSGSMNGKPIEQLNAGLQAFKESLLQDQLASLRVEVAVISFDGEARLEVDFSPPATFDPPVLQAGGGTSLGAAIITALDLLESRMAKYRAEGYPAHNGLNEAGVILRRHTPAIEAFNNAWWAELSRHSRRDQLSLNYVLDKLAIRPALFPGVICDNPGIVAYEGHLA